MKCLMPIRKKVICYIHLFLFDPLSCYLFSKWLANSDGSGPKPKPDIGRRAQARAWPGSKVKSQGAQRTLGM